MIPRVDSRMFSCCRFSLQTRRGGLVKIYDSALMSGVSYAVTLQQFFPVNSHSSFREISSKYWNTTFIPFLFISYISYIFCSQSKYKSLLVSEQTTVDELIQMLLSCYSSKERVEQFSLYEVCEGEEYQRKLHPDDSPLKVTQRWTSADRHLRIRRNPDYNPHRRKVSELAFALRYTIYDTIRNCSINFLYVLVKYRLQHNFYAIEYVYIMRILTIQHKRIPHLGCTAKMAECNYEYRRISKQCYRHYS